ncbi:MAG: TonB-dependent receptor [Gemmatimonadetes bacterium]|nr:TonB-dependent receptor [Gemmatimonadota bacterium]MDA1104063.1 TonB-dependent receptor [Gemmatimonadota bacterium]
MNLRRVVVVTAALFLAHASASTQSVAAQQDAFTLKGLIVSASPTPRSSDAVANHVTVLPGEWLRRAGVQSLADALRDVPGLHVVRGGSFGAVTSVFMRGGESDYTLVLVDGVQVNQAGGGFDFSSLSVENVERIEIVRGPSSALYGSDAVSGVIHVITRTGRGGPSMTMSLLGGSFGRQDWNADLVAGTDRAGYSLAVARQSTDGVLAFNNRHVNTVLSGRARLQADERTDIGLSLRITDRAFHYPTDASGATVDSNSFSFSDQTVAQLSVAHVLSDRFSAQVLLGVNGTDGGTDDAPDGPADTLGFFGFASLDHFRRGTAEVRAHVRSDHGVMTVGAEVEEERQRSFTESLSAFGPFHDRSESARGNQAYFVHATGGGSGVSVNAGARLEDNERFGRFVSWQAGATWRAPGAFGTLVRGAVGRAIKEPTFFENFATGFAVGNPDLDPERTLSWEVGVEQALIGDRVTAAVTFFDQAFDDLIQYTFAPANPGGPNFFNVASASSRGLEVDISATAGRFSGGLAWTRLDTNVSDSGFDDGPGASFVTGEPLLRRPADAGALHASAVWREVDVWARLAVTGERSDRDFATFPATPVVLPRFGLLTLGGEWRLLAGVDGRPRLSIQLRGENLLDADYEEVLGFWAPGRGLYLGGRVGLGGRP